MTQKRNSKKVKISSPQSEEKKRKSFHSYDTSPDSGKLETLESGDDDAERSSATAAVGEIDEGDASAQDSQKKVTSEDIPRYPTHTPRWHGIAKFVLRRTQSSR